MSKPFFAYILLCADRSYYVGHTDDLENRLAEHCEGGKCAHTTRRRPVRLVWSQEFPTRDQAREAEARIKGWTRRKKEALIRGDYSALVSLAKKQDWDGYSRRSRPRPPDEEATETDSPE